jgi:PIN domain nuclease of toxin-antitoxin system
LRIVSDTSALSCALDGEHGGATAHPVLDEAALSRASLAKRVAMLDVRVVP